METLYGKIPYIENSREIRKILDDLGYSPLNFFQGKDFVYPIVSNRANAHGNWKDYHYSTCNEKDLNFENFLDCKGNLKLFLDNLELPKGIESTTKSDNMEVIQKLQAEKAELLEALEKLLYGDFFNNVEKQDFIETLIQKHKK